MLPSGPLTTATDRAHFWQDQRPARGEDAWSEGYGTPSPARTDVLTVVPAGPILTRPQAVVARKIGALPDPLPTYGPFTLPQYGFAGERSWDRALFYSPGHPAWRPWFSLVLARLFDQTLGPAPPPGAVLNTGSTGPAWFCASEATVTYMFPCACDNRECQCTCLPRNNPCTCPFPPRTFSV